ncbi:MAG: site-2 protease family protein [Vicinamibacterales bacterium]
MSTAPALPVMPLPPVRPARRWVLPALALAATFLATTFFGGWHYMAFMADLGQPPPRLSYGDAAFWLGGLWFSLPVLAILGTHEAGHYIACRRYGVDASLPMFLPAPLPLTGTFGAFIRIRDVIPNKRALFDIGAAGPFAGFVVAVPLLILGLAKSRLVPMPHHVEMLALGRPLIYQLVQQILWGPTPDGQLLHLHPIARAAWFGLLATALNLFPIAQLDGGHVAYAVFGSRARWITLATAAAVLGLTFVSASWLAWAFLVVVTLLTAGISHPPTGDDHVPLGRRRTVLALAAALVFVLCFTAAPVEEVDAIDAAPSVTAH